MLKKYIIFDFNGTLLDDQTKELFDWVRDMIKNLSKKYKILISSQSDTDDIKDFLKEEGIYDFFDIVFGGDILEKWEKHIEVFNMYLEDQNFENRTVYVWDTEFDREIAKKAGISFVKIWKEWKDYYEIDNILEFEDYIEKVK